MTSSQRLQVVLFVVFLTGLSIGELDRFGSTWDESLGPIFYGDRYLDYYLSGDETLLDFERPHPGDKIPGHIDNYSARRFKPWAIWALPNIVSAIGCRLFFVKLGLFTFIEAHHLCNLLLFALFIILGTWLFRDDDPARVFLVACLFSYLHPSFHTHLLVNTKDLPMALSSILFILAYYRYRNQPSISMLLLSAILFAFALSTKIFALFNLIAIVVFEIIDALLNLHRRNSGLFRKYLRLGGALGFITVFGLLVFLLTWPYLYEETLPRLTKHLVYLRVESARGGLVPDDRPPTWQISALIEVLAGTPPTLLLLIILGAFSAWRSKKPIYALLFLDLFFSIYRNCLPGIARYDGIRHFLSVVPVMAIFAAKGLDLFMSAGMLGTLTKKTVLTAILLGLVIPLAQTYPYTYCYYNKLIGGLGGARTSLSPDSGDYWALSYKAGIAWLNGNAPKNSRIVVPIGQHVVEFSTDLRSDIKLIPTVSPEDISIAPAAYAEILSAMAEHPVYAMFIERPTFDNELTKTLKLRSNPLFRIEIDDRAILYIYRLQENILRKTDQETKRQQILRAYREYRFSQALELIERPDISLSDDIELSILKALTLWQFKEKKTAAISLLDDILTRSPDNRGAIRSLIQILSLELKRELPKYRNVWTAMIARHLHGAWLSTAMAWLDGDEKKITEAINAAPEEFWVQQFCAIWLMKNDMTEKAIDRFKAAIAIDPTIDIPYLHLGEIFLYNKKLPTEAEKYLLKARELNPYHHATWSALIDIAISTGRAKLALEELEYLSSRNPNDYWAPIRRGRLLFELGRIGEAMEIFDGLYRILYGNNSRNVSVLTKTYRAQVIHYLGEIYRNQGRESEVRTLYER